MNVKKNNTNSSIGRVTGLVMALMATVALISGCNQKFTDADRVIRAEEGQLTVAEENGLNETTYKVAVDAKVVLDGQPATLQDLESGDAVRLTSGEQDGVTIVSKIEAKSKEAVKAEQKFDPLTDSTTAPMGPLTAQPLTNAVVEDAGETNDPLTETPQPESDQPIDPEAGAPPTDNLDNSVDDGIDNGETDVLPATTTHSGRITHIGDDQFVIKDSTEAVHTFAVDSDTKYTLDGNEATFDQLMVDHSVHVMARADGEQLVAKMVDATSDYSSD